MGKWRLIQMDEAYGPVLANRSNVDLKARRAHTKIAWKAVAGSCSKGVHDMRNTAAVQCPHASPDRRSCTTLEACHTSCVPTLHVVLHLLLCQLQLCFRMLSLLCHACSFLLPPDTRALHPTSCAGQMAQPEHGHVWRAGGQTEKGAWARAPRRRCSRRGGGRRRSCGGRAGALRPAGLDRALASFRGVNTALLAASGYALFWVACL